MPSRLEGIETESISVQVGEINQSRLHVPSRLEGIETLDLLSVRVNEFGLHVPSRLEGIETLSYETGSLLWLKWSTCAFPFGGN